MRNMKLDAFDNIIIKVILVFRQYATGIETSAG